MGGWSLGSLLAPHHLLSHTLLCPCFQTLDPVLVIRYVTAALATLRTTPSEDGSSGRFVVWSALVRGSGGEGDVARRATPHTSPRLVGRHVLSSCGCVSYVLPACAPTHDSRGQELGITPTSWGSVFGISGKHYDRMCNLNVQRFQVVREGQGLPLLPTLFSPSPTPGLTPGAAMVTPATGGATMTPATGASIITPAPTTPGDGDGPGAGGSGAGVKEEDNLGPLQKRQRVDDA